nr:regulator of nonsense transcripts 3B-like isoform X1 [Cherax quadricarinatus]XP_053651936.1 regulator of nonsense transcripts 3B-like isoform X1 [Cherax quadricarinatus]XP_053651937.1 regulator of nonsense transcripts 3B-like isoform X1 [Cherax quadricarinatus]
MTVKTTETPRREGSKSYVEGSLKRTSENTSSSRHNVKTKKEKTASPLTKVVVRRLPPNMTEEEFREAVSPLPEHDYFTFSPADNSLGPYSFTRAYINFKNVDDVFTFRDKFDGYVFVDQKGNEHPAMVEFAPFQKIPKRTNGKKRDARCGTIDQDPDFLAFLESITNPVAVTLPPLEAVLEEIQAQDRELKANNGIIKVKTPLLEFIEQKKAEKLRSKEEKKEERRRKEFERKKAREEDKRKKKDGKDVRDIKKKEDLKDDNSVKVLRPERTKEDYLAEARLSRKEREKERYEKERLRRIEEDRLKREREKGRLIKKEKEREDRLRRHEEKTKVKEEERIKQREEVKEEWQEERVQVSKSEGVKSKRYSEGRRKEEREREKRIKEEKDKEKKSKDEHEKEPTPKDEKESVSEALTGATEPMEMSETIETQQENAEERNVKEETNQEEPAKEPQESEKHSEEKSCARKKREKDPRVERRIRNKDRPAMALYRPGQSRLSSRMRQDREEGAETSSSSPSPVMPPGDPKKYQSQTKKENSDTQKETLNSKEGSVDSRSDSLDLDPECPKDKDVRGREDHVGTKTLRESRVKSNEACSERYYSKFRDGRNKGHHTGRKRETEDDIEVRDGAHGEQSSDVADNADTAADMKKFPGVKTMTFRRSVSRE